MLLDDKRLTELKLLLEQNGLYYEEAMLEVVGESIARFVMLKELKHLENDRDTDYGL